MSRLSIAVLAPILVTAATAGADTYGGWQYTAPRGYAVQPTHDHLELVTQTGGSFCKIALFEARELADAAPAESAVEWQNIVTHSFMATVRSRATLRTTRGAPVAATTATVADGDGNRYVAVHYVLTPPGMIGSVLLLSSTDASLRACERAATPFVASLAIDWTAPRFNDPEARVETPIGRWAVAGDVGREYVFGADGSYAFHSETVSTDTTRVLDELGTYTVTGTQLTLAPTRATSAIIDHGIAKPATKLAAGKTTYTWGKRYRPDGNEWLLILMSPKPTTRDGKLPADAPAYQYSDHAKPAFKYAPQPGV